MDLQNFHQFEHKNLDYLYQVDRGNAFRISSDLASIIKMIKKNPDECTKKLYTEVGNILKPLIRLSSEGSCSPEISSKESVAVSSISLNVIQDCNMRCKYCYGQGGTYSQKGYMQYETAVTAIEWLVRTSGKSKLAVIFFGGEPLLNFNLIKNIIGYIKSADHLIQKNFEFSITTNGTIFNREIIKILNEHQFNVTISFDGDKQVQNNNRPMRNGHKSFRLVQKNIKRFLKSRDGNALARATISSGNTDWKMISQCLCETGFKRYDYAPVTADKSALFALSDAEYSRLCFDLERQADELISNFDTQGPGAGLRIWDMIRSLKTHRKRFSGCGAGHNLMAISSTGGIYPCHRFVGNDTQAFGDIYNFDHGKQKSFLENRSRVSAKCTSCWARFLCGGGCLHDNYIYSGHMARPDPRFCKEIKRRIEMAIYVYDVLKKNKQIS